MTDTLDNNFKRRLAAGESLIGLWVALAESYTAEICAGAGFDWLLLDGEHGPNDVRSLLRQLQAVAPYPAHPVVRPPVADVGLIKQYLDIGVQTLLLPMIDDAEQAAEMVRATRYPPDGVFIGPSDLAAAFGHIGQTTHPEVVAAIENGIAAIRRQGKAAGILAVDEPVARRYLDLGCGFVAVGTDVGLLARHAERLAKTYKK